MQSKKILFSVLAFFIFSNSIYSQGKIPMKKKSFLGALAFLPNSKLSAGYNQVSLSAPNDKDPLVDPNKWYEEGNKGMRGMMGDAVLFLEWWTTMESPSERYKFDWTSSGYFEFMTQTPSGIPTIKRIDRYKLEKYPNLVRWFDNIKPIEVDFQFTFHTGNIPDQAYWDFRNKYKILEDLGSAGYSINYTRQLNGDFILYKASRKKQDWTSPAMTLGGWNEFLNFQDKYNNKRSRLIELFKLGETLVISHYKISKIKWRLSDFEYIVKKFEDYESGKDKPTAFDEVEQGKDEAKAGDGSWDEADAVDSETESFYDKDTRLYGVKTKKGKILQKGKYNRIVKSTLEKYYIASSNNTVYLLNNMGREVYSKNYNESPSIGSCKNGQLYASVQNQSYKMGDYSYYVNSNTSDYFQGGTFKRSVKYYTTYQPLSLTVTSASDNRTQDELDAAERAWKKDRKRLIDQKISELKSSGHVGSDNLDCF